MLNQVVCNGKIVSYKQAYGSLGEERLQQGVPKNLSHSLKVNQGKGRSYDKSSTKSDYDQYWDLRKDWAWIDIPGKNRLNRKTRKFEFKETVTQILVDLDPGTVFNPSDAWKAELEKQEVAQKELLKEQAVIDNASNTKTKGKKTESKQPVVKKQDQLIEQNKEKIAKEKFAAEVTRIRNCIYSSSKEETQTKLIGLIRSTKIPKARAVLVIEILKFAYSKLYETTGDKKLLFETLWAIDGPDIEVIDFKIPEPAPGAKSLVYDDFKSVESLLRRANRVRDQESDLIRLQLVEMSDCLPPLTKFTFGHSLDPWQKKVLRWIDDGKSVVISAPTSSGKTVLSSYVAVIFKHNKNLKMVKDNNNADEKEQKIAADADEDSDADDNDENDSEDENIVDDNADDNNEQQLEDEDDVEYLERRVQEQLELDNNNAKGGVDNKPNQNLDSPPEDNVAQSAEDELVKKLIAKDKIERTAFTLNRIALQGIKEDTQRVLFVVPAEPLVWQVAAYFSKLLRSEGDKDTKVAIVTPQMSFSQKKYFNDMPKIVVGTPLALESALTKARGLVGLEFYGRNSGAIIPGGFDHFDWVVYDEVHALDGAEGAALQRLIRMMNCKFLALSATIGNAAELKGWMEKMKGEQIQGVETIDVAKEQISHMKESSVASQTNPPAVNSLFDSEVNILSHQVRFINLQRYVWDCEKSALVPVSPLAAIENIESIQTGKLNNSSLSFTSQDSYRAWLEIKRVYPLHDPIVAGLDPKVYFEPKERITLHRTKEYEDFLKGELQKLAIKYPKETQELIYTFNLQDSPVKEFDLCDLILALREKDMLPCLPFHLNTFEAIKLFQHLLASLEYRQKKAHPNYYTKLQSEYDARVKSAAATIKDTGKNDKAREELEKTGDLDVSATFSIDPTAPHPKYAFSNGTITDLELQALCEEMEKTDGFKKRANTDQKSRNESILQHALIRGLRRGIGLFINEVSFPAYRRTIQKLASKGKLAVVISDDSLAFGVNMPFRTCVFCGEMFGELDELMAQQMSGRAGRRGLDTQGNIVYAGISSSHVRKLMLGKVANISGRNTKPRYETLFLQQVLSPKHVGWSRAEVLGGITLSEHIDNQVPPSEFTLKTSRKILTDLKFVTPLDENGNCKPSPMRQATWALLAMMWELRGSVEESITIGCMFPDIIEYFNPIVNGLNFSERKQNAEVLEQHMYSFLVILSIALDRTAWDPNSGAPQLLDLDYFKQPQRQEFFHEWEHRFAAVQASIPEKYAFLRSPIPAHTPLDGTFFQCLYDRHYVMTLPEQQKQKLKAKAWRVGVILQIMTNNAWPEPTYFRFEHFILRACFKKVKYLNFELIHHVVDYPDISAYDLEARADEGKEVHRPIQAYPWKDNNSMDENKILPNDWIVALEQAAVRYREVVAQISQAPETTSSPIAVKSKLDEESIRIVSIFKYLKSSDCSLVQILTKDPKEKSFVASLVSAIGNCSMVNVTVANSYQKSPILFIAILSHLTVRVIPSLMNKFVVFLRQAFDDELLPEDAIREWYGMAYDQYQAETICVKGSISESVFDSLKSNSKILMDWLDVEEEEDEDEEDDA
eukprot:gene5470-7573_t